MAVVGKMLVERWSGARPAAAQPCGLAHQRDTAASAGFGFDAYGPPVASLLGSDGCDLAVRDRSVHRGSRTNNV
jgi:hypothetical protein